MLLGLAGAFQPSARALGPHEIVILANGQDADSVFVAEQYAAMRQVPECNIITLALPRDLPLAITPAQFNSLIRLPVEAACAERGIRDHVLAWAYSSGFPIRTATDPVMSLQGITFLRGTVPAPESIAKGTYSSPFFGGPSSTSQPGFPPQSLDMNRAWMGKSMPVPSIMLGFAGPRGNTRDEIMACLKKGAAADGTHPAGSVYIVTNNDIRSLCRQWEIPALVQEMAAGGRSLVVSNLVPRATDSPPLSGFMTGNAEIPGLGDGQFEFLPGAMADHLTSFGAAFDNSSQTKITAWIRSGATAAAGTVVEPYALWMKFPHARLFAYPPAGCTILESYYQAIRCPLQILIIGEPLSSPWAPASTLTLKGLPGGGLSRRCTVSAAVHARNDEIFNRFAFLVDGRILQPAGTNASILLDPAGLRRGRHTLRAVAYRVGMVRAQIFCETRFEVE